MFSRVFSAECDECGNSYDEGFYYKSSLLLALKSSGWTVNAGIIICEECLDNIEEWVNND